MESLFYVRVRGKISGPFDIAALQKLVRRGGLSRIHEISSDRATWSAAGEFEDLFPSTPASLPPQPTAAVETSAEQQVIEPQAAVVTSPSEILYYYTQRGSTVGPVRLSILKTLAENGTLRKDDLVWRENSDTGAPAAQTPVLAPIFAGQNSSQQPTGRLEPAAMSGRTLLVGGGFLLVIFIGAVAWWYIGPKLAQPKQTASSTAVPAPVKLTIPIRGGSPTSNPVAATTTAPEPVISTIPLKDATPTSNPVDSDAAGEELRKSNVGMVVVMVTYYAATNDDKVINIDIPVATGTAFAIESDGTMVTNAHVANAGDNTRMPATIEIKELSSELFRPKGDPFLKVCFGPGFKDQFAARATVVDDEIDLAFLQIDHKFPHPLKFAQVAVHQGARVSACGFPGVVTDLLNATYKLTPDQKDKIGRRLKNGRVSVLDGFNPSIFENILTEGVVGNAHAEVDGQKYIEFSAKVAHGNSGGPLLNAENEVVGVVSMKIENNGNAEYEGYNYAISASVVQDELKVLRNKQ
jgi:S1-C subfamily serine protease